MGLKIDKTYKLGANEGSSQRATNWYIIAHETANPRSTGRDEAAYMKRSWGNAYTQYIVGDGKIYMVGEPGYVSWGALNANPYSPVQIELQHTSDKALFKKNYALYIELIRESANKYGIPLTLDAGGAGTKGVKSHAWCSAHHGGDHSDPYGYLSQMGVSKAQFAKDIKNGVGKVASTPSKPAKKPAVTPANSKPVKDGKVGDQVKVVIALYKDSYGKGKSTTKKGQTGKIKKIANAGSKKYLIENWGWAHPNDIQMVKKASAKPTANKAKDWSKEYYTSNPKRVKLLKDDGLYGKNDVKFTGGKVGGSYKKGTVFLITGIKKRSDGLPRLVTQSGFLLTANRKYVKQV